MSLVWILYLNSKLGSFTLQVLRILTSMNYSLYLHFSLKLHGTGVQISISIHGFVIPLVLWRSYSGCMRDWRWLYLPSPLSDLWSWINTLAAKHQTCSGEMHGWQFPFMAWDKTHTFYTTFSEDLPSIFITVHSRRGLVPLKGFKEYWGHPAKHIWTGLRLCQSFFRCPAECHSLRAKEWGKWYQKLRAEFILQKYSPDNSARKAILSSRFQFIWMLKPYLSLASGNVI